FPTRKIPDPPITVIAMNESIKVVVGNELKQLSENGLAAVHRGSSPGIIDRTPRKRRFFPNRLKPSSLATPWLDWIFLVLRNPQPDTTGTDTLFLNDKK